MYRFVLAACVLLVSCTSSVTPETGGRDAIASGAHPLTRPPRSSWPTNGGDIYNRRYSPLDGINRDNVASLKGKWLTHLRGSGIGPRFSGEAQPLVADGVIYISTGANDIFALSVEAGEILWQYEANLDPDNSAVCCGWTSRGVGIGDGKIFGGQLDGKLVALDQSTGRVLWSVQAERWQEGFTITSAPLYFDGLVYTGFAGGERGIRGRVKAYDADDGSLVWTFYTIPGPGEIGHETWPQDNDIWMDGGAPVWQTPAVDPELGLLYFSTGNAGPDYNGSVRAGDNLFSASIVALDAKTGEYRWHFQQVHHDIWDYDAPSPVVLFDIEIDGRMRKGLAQASKTGWVYILDRTNGEPLIGIEERPVPQEPRQATSATQPYPLGDAFIPQSIPIPPEGFVLRNQGRIFTPFWTDNPSPTKPGGGGGANWPPSSYDPATGILYVCARDSAWAYVAAEMDDERPDEGVGYIGGGFVGFPQRSLGIFAALDMHTNRLVWQQHWPDICYSGSITTGGGLVFVGRSDGRLTAVDSGTGERLWEFQTGAGMNSTVSVFEHEGSQYVVAYAAGNLFAGSDKGDSVWLFSLDGTFDEVEPGSSAASSAAALAAAAAVTEAARAEAAAAATAQAAEAAAVEAAARATGHAATSEVSAVAPADVSAANPANGRRVYESACMFCHGPGATGGPGGGPNLRSVGDHTVMHSTVTNGRNMMPAFGGVLTEQQIQDVITYVVDVLSQ